MLMTPIHHYYVKWYHISPSFSSNFRLRWYMASLKDTSERRDVSQMSNKRILLTGGGTAGHVIVNLALIPEFRRDGWSIDYIGSKTGIERKLIEASDGVTYHPISTGKLRRSLSTEHLKDPFKVFKGTFEAWRIIGKCKPDVLFSKGGFVSLPAVLAAKLRGVPAIIHESD